MTRSSSCMVWLLAVSTMSSVLATEPLHDSLTIDASVGRFLPERCCWVPMPPSEELLNARRAERCSAIGGPVGRFKLDGERIWLIGLRRCAGELPLKAIFPNLPDPAPADWLSGKFTAVLVDACQGGGGSPLYRRQVHLVLEAGRVVTRQEVKDGESSCPYRGLSELVYP